MTKTTNANRQNLSSATDAGGRFRSETTTCAHSVARHSAACALNEWTLKEMRRGLANGATSVVAGYYQPVGPHPMYFEDYTLMDHFADVIEHEIKAVLL